MTKRILLSLLLPLLVIAVADSERAFAQPDTTGTARRSGDSSSATAPPAGTTPPRHWYDTLTVTQPRYARTTPAERLALAAFTALALPVGLTVGVITLLPPSFNVLSENGTYQTGFAISTGVGFGGDTSQVIFFPACRIQLEGAYFLTRNPGPMVRASLLFDKPLFSIHPRKFFWVGAAGGAGVSTDFEMVAPYAEGWVGLINPMGIRFITLFPQHNYGIRGRAGYNLATSKPWYEISLCATSTFWY
jgi:hypothetical protein